MSDVALAQSAGLLPEFRRHFAASRSGMIGLGLVSLLVFAAVLAPLLAPHAPNQQIRTAILHPPTWLTGTFPLGTDDLGRDVLSRLLYGARLSLSIGAVVVTLSFLVGTLLGLIAGFAGSVVDALVMRLMDMMLALPTLLLAIAVVAILGPGLFNAMLAVSIVQLPGFVRLTRAAVLIERSKDYVAASRMAGAGRARLMFLIVLPNCLAPLIVQASLGFSNAILDTAALGFLGLGAQPPTPEWGTMLADAMQFVQSAWWVVTFPGLAILLTVLGFNLVGDGLRDALDPRLKLG
jgi:dipeptide transport system permease protein